MSIASFSVKQPVLVNCIFVAALVMGAVATGDMARERYPRTPLNKVFGVVIYPGTSPTEMETIVAIPLEEKLDDVDDLDWMTTTSSEGKTVVEMKFSDELEDLDETAREVRSKIGEVDLPEDAFDPEIIPVITDEVMPAIQVAMGGDFPDATIKDIAERMKSDLLEIEEASEIEVRGAREREIWVEVDPASAEEFRIPLMAVDEALAAGNMNLPAGKVTLGEDEYIVRTVGEIPDARQIRDVVIDAEPDGRMVRIGDVAEVRDTFAEDRVRLRLDGKPTVFITVYKKSGEDVIDLVEEVKHRCDAFAARTPGLTVTYRNDQSIAVEESMSVLWGNAALGAFLVMSILFALMSFQGAILALLGIPFAFLAAFLVLRSFGFTMNTLTLFSCILVLGMLVDDAIVIIENVHRHIEAGMGRLEAAIRGTDEVVWPVFSAIATTVAAFLPMLMMEGIMGQFLWNFPIIVSVCLGMSLLQAFFVLPSHLRHFGPRAAKVKPRRFFVAIQGAYRRVLTFAVGRRYATIGGIVAFAAICIGLVVAGIKTGYIPVEMFGAEDVSTITMNVELPVGTGLDETERTVSEMEMRILAMKERPIKSIVTTVGQIVDEHRYLTNTHLAQLDMDLGTRKERRSRASAVEQRIRDLLADMAGVRRIGFAEFGWGPPVGRPVEIRVVGDDMEALKKHALGIEEVLGGVPGVVDIRDTLAPGKDELLVTPIRDRAALVGMSSAAIAMTVRNALEGHVATKLRVEGGDEVDVVVKLASGAGSTVEDVKAMRIMTPRGPVPLSHIAGIEVGRGLAEIPRRDGDRYAQVTANVVRGVTSSDAVNRLMRKKLGGFEDTNPGFRIQFGGEAEEQAKSFGSLYKAFILAILLVYVILGAQFRSFFQPLIVMVTVPFSFVGVFLGLMVMRLPFSLLALITVVGLAGVVVNDAIVLVDFANRRTQEGTHHVEAAIEAGCVRLRAILMTSSTTIGGLLPLALGIGGTSPMWKPMASSMVWGLGFSTVLTLVVIPSLYAIAGDVAQRLRRSR